MRRECWASRCVKNILNVKRDDVTVLLPPNHRSPQNPFLATNLPLTTSGVAHWTLTAETLITTGLAFNAIEEAIFGETLRILNTDTRPNSTRIQSGFQPNPWLLPQGELVWRVHE